ncbi:MAG: DNA repair protein RecN [Chthoniobacterales bacterium]
MPATLRSLRIRNLALVESLDWELESGFNVVTGETGAGKSIILGALKLVLGERADKSLIRAGADQCSVETLFELEDSVRIDQLLEEQGIDPCEEGRLLLRRIFAVTGTNRQFINGSQTTLAVLKEIADRLVDLHGPHDHQSLLSRVEQLRLVDAFAENNAVLNEYQRVFQAQADLHHELHELQSEYAEDNIALWRHQLAELQGAGLKVGELAALQAKYAVAANARRILELTCAIIHGLSQAEESVLMRLAEVARLLKELERLDASTAEFSESHRSAAVELEELERAILRYQDKLEIDPGALHQMEERLNLIQGLQRKYHQDEKEMLELVSELEEKLSRVERRDEFIAQLQAKIEVHSRQLLVLCAQLAEKRRSAASELGRRIGKHLSDLGFHQARFEIYFEALDDPGNTGADAVEFLFASNPGEPLRPLRAIASSGEISRIMLAFKTALAQQDLVGLLVFDEIDANVGGEIANAVGSKMKALGATHQVLAITHMPQVAAAAPTHFLVSKEVDDGRTRTALEKVRDDRRVDEIARMLGGKTKSAVAHARELLKRF